MALGRCTLGPMPRFARPDPRRPRLPRPRRLRPGVPRSRPPRRPWTSSPTWTRFIGTGGVGFGVGSTYPGPALPFALAHPGPDTRAPGGAVGFAHCAGYWYPDPDIAGFSLTRMNGTGVPDYGNLAFMPVDGLKDSDRYASGYAAPYDHSREQASPGYYRVTLDDGIEVELTSTLHDALLRITFPDGVDPVVLLDAAHALGEGKVGGGGVTFDAGGATGTAWVNDRGQLSRSAERLRRLRRLRGGPGAGVGGDLGRHRAPPRPGLGDHRRRRGGGRVPALRPGDPHGAHPGGREPGGRRRRQEEPRRRAPGLRPRPGAQGRRGHLEAGPLERGRLRRRPTPGPPRSPPPSTTRCSCPP